MVEVLPVLIGALGSVTEEFDRWTEKECCGNIKDCLIRNCKDIEESV